MLTTVNYCRVLSNEQIRVWVVSCEVVICEGEVKCETRSDWSVPGTQTRSLSICIVIKFPCRHVAVQPVGYHIRPAIITTVTRPAWTPVTGRSTGTDKCIQL